MARVVVVHQQPLVCSGVRAALVSRDIEVLGEVGTANGAIQMLERADPDVVIVGLELPDRPGTDLIRQIRSRRPRVACIALAPVADESALFGCVVAGAAAFHVHDVSPDRLAETVMQAAAGSAFITEQALDELRTRPSLTPRDVLFRDFTPRERHILGLVATGRTNREIAAEVQLAEKTVRNHVSVMLGKAGLRNRTQLATAVVRARRPA